MNHKKTGHIINKYFIDLNKKFKKIKTGYDIEDIHQFRVSYKKLRAFLHLLSHEGKKVSVVKKLKEAYDISGKIRDLQLQQQRILHEVNDNPESIETYIGLITKNINDYKHQLDDLEFKETLAESKKKILSNIHDKFSSFLFKLFVEEKFAAIDAVIKSRHFTDDNIHSIRKMLKDIFYDVKLYKAKEHELLLKFICSDTNETYFTTLMDGLGIYQDTCKAVDFLKNEWINSPDKHQQLQLQHLRNRLVKEKFRQKKILVKQLISLPVKQSALS